MEDRQRLADGGDARVSLSEAAAAEALTDFARQKDAAERAARTNS